MNPSHTQPHTKPFLARVCAAVFVSLVFLGAAAIPLHAKAELTASDVIAGAATGLGATPVGIALKVLSDGSGGAPSFWSDPVTWFEYRLLTVGAVIAGLGGQLLDITISKLILEMHSYVGDSSSGVGGAIIQGWTIVRDIANLLFIFGFVYIGIMTIFDYESAQTKKTLASIIIGAILINFSLFFTKVIIDASNILAVELHQKMTNDSSINIGEQLAQFLGISTLYQTPQDTNKMIEYAKPDGFWFYVVGMIFLMIAGYVLAAGGILIIIRFVALVLLMILSPLLFAAGVFSFSKNAAQDLWGKLISYSFFAPAYMFMLYATILVLTGLQTSMGISATNNLGQTMAGLGEANNGYSPVLNLFLASGFIIAALAIAKKLSIYGGDKSVSMLRNGASSTGKFLRNATLGNANKLRRSLQSYAGRNTIGRASEALTKKIDAFVASNTKEGTKPFKRGLAAVAGSRTVRGTVASGQNAKFGGSYSHADNQAYERDQRSRSARIREQQDFEQALATHSAAIASGDAAAIQAAEREVQRMAEKASVAMLSELSTEQLKQAAGFLSDAQIEGVAKAASNDAQTREVKEARSKKLQEIYRNDSKALGKASVEHLAALGNEFLRANAQHLNSKQMEGLQARLPSGEFGDLDTERTRRLTRETRDFLLDRKESEVAKLPFDVLKKLGVGGISTGVLSQIAAGGNLNQKQQKELKDMVMRHVQATGTAEEQQRYDDWFKTDRVGQHFGRG